MKRLLLLVLLPVISWSGRLTPDLPAPGSPSLFSTDVVNMQPLTVQQPNPQPQDLPAIDDNGLTPPDTDTLNTPESEPVKLCLIGLAAMLPTMLRRRRRGK